MFTLFPSSISENKASIFSSDYFCMRENLVAGHFHEMSSKHEKKAAGPLVFYFVCLLLPETVHKLFWKWRSLLAESRNILKTLSFFSSYHDYHDVDDREPRLTSKKLVSPLEVGRLLIGGH